MTPRPGRGRWWLAGAAVAVMAVALVVVLATGDDDSGDVGSSTVTTTAGATAPGLGTEVTGGDGDFDTFAAALAAARQHWDDNRPPDGYRFEFAYQCFCSDRGPWVAEVDGDGDVVSSTGPEQTVDRMFDTLEETIELEVHSVSATFDPELGYPVSWYIDHDENVADEEGGAEILSLTPR